MVKRLQYKTKPLIFQYVNYTTDELFNEEIRLNNQLTEIRRVLKKRGEIET